MSLTHNTEVHNSGIVHTPENISDHYCTYVFIKFEKHESLSYKVFNELFGITNEVILNNLIVRFTTLIGLFFWKWVLLMMRVNYLLLIN